MAAKKKNQLQLHRDKECLCFDSDIKKIDNRCIYQTFPDGWSFTPDVGNGQKRGEVFTPLWVVNKMIVEVGLIPASAVYDNFYDKKDAVKVIQSTVVEPAVGTGNYSSTIFYHKLKFAEVVSISDSGVKNIPLFQKYFLEALASIYMFDIDAGNLATTKKRFFKENENDVVVDTDREKVFWFQNIVHGLDDSIEVNSKIETVVKENIEKSLLAAQKNWEKYLTITDIASYSYENFVGEKIPSQMVSAINKILEENVKLFNGIVENDTVSDDFVCPGFKNVVWSFWNIKVESDKNQDLKKISLTKNSVPLLGQIRESELSEAKKDSRNFLNEHTAEAEGDDLFSLSITKFDSAANERTYKKMIEKETKIEKELEELNKLCKSETIIFS